MCSIPISVFLVSPYNLPFGSSIIVQVTASNLYGSSNPVIGNGAVILTLPTAPIVSNFPSLTD